MSLRVGDRGVVVQNVQPTEMLDRLAHHRLDAVGIGGVEPQRQPVAFQRIGGALRRFQIDIGAHDFRAFTRQAQRGRRADTTAAAGYDCHFACQTLHPFYLLSLLFSGVA